MDISGVWDRFLNILFVTCATSSNVNLVNGLLSVEQSGSLFQTAAPSFNDEDVAEDRLEGEPAAVDDLQQAR